MFAFALYTPHRASAATRTWDGGCGVDTNWSCDANWSLDTEPVAGDTVTFDNTSDNNSTVDATFTGTVTTININSGYDGTITMARSLTVSTSFVQHAGTFTASNQTLDMNGSFTLDAGVFTASSGSTTLAGAMTISGAPTFNANAGTFTFDGTTAATLSCDNVTFSTVTFTHSNVLKTVSSNCSMPLGANPSVGGNTTATVTLNGSFSGTGTLTTVAGFTVNSTAPLSGFTAITSNVVNISGGNFTAPSGVFTVNSTFTINAAATFDANGGTVTFASTTAAVLSCGNKTFNLVTFTHQNVAKTVSSDCSLPLGNNPVIGGNLAADLTLAGTISGTGTATIGTGASGNVLTLQTSPVISGFTALVTGGLTVSSGTADLSALSTLTASGAFSQTGGTLTLPSTSATFSSTAAVSAGAIITMSAGTTTFPSTFTINAAATFNANGGTVNFSGSASATLSCGNAVFNLVNLTHTSNPRTISSDCSLPLGNNPSPAGPITLAGTLSGTGTLTMSTGFIISSATATLSGFSNFDVNSTFTMNAATSFTAPAVMSVSGSFTIDSTATFNANGGTLTFDGSTATLACGNATFNAVSFTHTVNTKTINSDCSLPLGNNPTLGSSAASVTLNGTLSGMGTLTALNTFTVNSSSPLSGFTGVTSFVLNISGGTFTAPSGTLTVSSNFTLNSAVTWNANGGTVDFNSGTATLACGNKTFNLVTITHTVNTKTVNSDCNLPLGNNPTVGSGATADLTLAGTLSGTGTLTIAGATSGNVLTLQTGASISGFSSIVAGGLTVSSGTNDLSSIATMTVAGSFTLSAGSITLPSTSATFATTSTVSSGATLTLSAGTTTFNGALTINSGSTLNANSGTLSFGGTGSVSIACGNKTFNLVTFVNTSGTKTVGSDCTMPLGASPTVGSGGNVTLNGTLSGSGTLTMSSGTLTLGATSALTGFSGLAASALTVSSATKDFSSYSLLTVASTYSQTGGTITLPTAGATFSGSATINTGSTFTASSGTTTFNNALTINSGATFNHNNGTVGFGGTSDADIVCGGKTFNLVTFTHTAGTKVVYADCTFPLGANPDAGLGGSISLAGTFSGTGTLTTTGTFFISNQTGLSGFSGLQTDNLTIDDTITVDLSSYNTLDVNGNFEILGGTFTATSANMTIGGNITFYLGATFNHNNGTVILDGNDQTITPGINTITFNNLTKIVASPATLTFPASRLVNIAGTLTLKGSSASNLLTLASSTPGGANWQIDAQGTRDIRYVNVADSSNINGTSPIIAYDSVDGGDNSNWSFATTPTPPGPTPDPGGGTTPSPGTTITVSPSTSTQSSITIWDQSADSTPEVTVATPEAVKLDPNNSDNGSSQPKTDDQGTGATTGNKTKWFALLIFIVIVLGIFFFFILAKRRKSDEDDTSGPNVISPSGNNPGPDKFIQ